VSPVNPVRRSSHAETVSSGVYGRMVRTKPSSAKAGSTSSSTRAVKRRLPRCSINLTPSSSSCSRQSSNSGPAKPSTNTSPSGSGAVAGVGVSGHLGVQVVQALHREPDPLELFDPSGLDFAGDQTALNVHRFQRLANEAEARGCKVDDHLRSRRLPLAGADADRTVPAATTRRRRARVSGRARRCSSGIRPTASQLTPSRHGASSADTVAAAPAARAADTSLK